MLLILKYLVQNNPYYVNTNIAYISNNLLINDVADETRSIP